MQKKIDNLKLTKAISPSKNLSSSVCSDYLNELKLKRLLTRSLEDQETIDNLKGKKGFGKTNYMVLKQAREMIDMKVQRLDRDRISLYLKKIENKKPMSNCILLIKKRAIGGKVKKTFINCCESERLLLLLL